MDQTQIRKNCYPCGHRCLMLMKGAEMSTDFCDKALMECSRVAYCHPSIRIPRKKGSRVQEKRAVEE